MLKGQKASDETRLKMSISKKGNPTWNKGLKMSDEYIEKNRLGHIGLKANSVTKIKMSLSHLGHKMPNRKRFSEEYKNIMSLKRKGKLKSEEWKSLMRELWSKPEYKQKLIDVGKRHWADVNYKNRQVKLMMSGNGTKPTNPELELNSLLDKILPNEYKYVGDGKHIIDGMCPDFIHNNGCNKVIELYGDYWHKNDNPQDRINRFMSSGYDCLIIWEHELRNHQDIISKIFSFHFKKTT